MYSGEWKPPNRICYDWVKQLEQQRHLQTLNTIKSTLDNRSPLKPYFLTNSTTRKNRYTRSKSISKIKAKDRDITTANAILLQKMMRIEQQTGRLNKDKIVQQYRPMTPQFNSYNNLQRRKTIENENQHIARRLLNATTHYDIQKIRQNSERQISLKKNLCQNSSNSMQVIKGRSRYLDLSRVSIPMNMRTDGFDYVNISNHNVNRSLDMRQHPSIRDQLAEQQRRLFQQQFQIENAEQSQ